jgi:hypothetical protein
MRRYFIPAASGNFFASFRADVLINGFIILHGGELIQ